MAVADHHARRDRSQRTVGSEVLLLELPTAALHHGELDVRVHGGVAQTGKVLEAAGDSGVFLQAGQEGAGPAADRVGIGAVGTVADPVGRVGGTEVDDRREVEVEAERGERPAGRGGEAARGVVAATCQRRGGRRGPEPGSEPAHAAAFLIDRDQRRPTQQGQHGLDQRGGLPRRFQVAGEQDHPGRPACAQPLRRFPIQLRARQADHQGAARFAFPIRHHVLVG